MALSPQSRILLGAAPLSSYTVWGGAGSGAGAFTHTSPEMAPWPAGRASHASVTHAPPPPSLSPFYSRQQRHAGLFCVHKHCRDDRLDADIY
jgi:hypothetical protein